MAEEQTDRTADPHIGLFLGDQPTRDLEHWVWLWTGNHPFPVRASRGGLLGRLLVFGKRLLRPFVKFPINDLLDRQRTFNLILLGWQQERVALRRHIEELQRDLQGAIEAHAKRLEDLDQRTAVGFNEIMLHNDALFARVDQKLDRYRREARNLWSRLSALIAANEASPGRPSGEVLREQGYVSLELRYRGSEEEIAERLAVYLPHLRERSPVLDLGCGRGEALAIFAAHGLEARGVDSSGEMVARCQEKSLAVEQGDLLEYLARIEEETLGAVVSFHVIEHLPPPAVDQLVRLAWRALRPGGILILETPSPLSLVTAARNFWIDPTHIRPVHPGSLEVLYREAGFEPVHQLDLHPFSDRDRLPEIDLAQVGEGQRELADQVNRLRDMLDDLLFGNRDFAMLGIKP